MKTKRDTSPSVVYQMVNFMTDLNIPKDFTSKTILEPSAGEGLLLDYLKLNSKTNLLKAYSIDCFETNVDKRNLLKAKNYDLVGSDYLKENCKIKYDYIIACPPFKNGTDCLHIQKMYKDLKKEGYLITLCHSRYLIENKDIYKEFRSFLSSKEYYTRFLTDYSFIEKHKTVPTSIIILKK